MAEKKKLVIIDGKSVFYRAYFAVPNLSNSQGLPTSGVYGFAMMALRLLKDLNPDYVIVAWDKSKTNIRSRRKLYPQYKAQRKPMPDDLRQQIPLLREMLKVFGWPLLELDDFEADDIMAALSQQATKQGLKTILVTSDLDILQAVTGDTELLALKRGLTQTVKYTKERFTEEYGLTPDQFIDYKALKGDSSDNVPGVAGVGDKTAKNLIQTYGSLDGVYQNLDKVADSLRKKLEADKDMAYLSHKLLEIRFDAPAQLDLKAADVSDCNPEAIASLFHRLNFRRLFADLPSAMQVKTAQTATSDQTTGHLTVIKLQRVDDPAELPKLKTGARMVIHPVAKYQAQTGQLELREALISPDPQTAVLVSGLALTAFPNYLKEAGLIGFDLKKVYKLWPDLNIKSTFDTNIAGFLLNSLLRQNTLREQAEQELGVTFTASVDAAPLTDETAQLIAQSLWQLYQDHAAKLKAIPRLQKVADEIDFPTVPVLARMENAGVKIDLKYFAKMAKSLERRIEDTQELIYKEAKEEFNIGSPQQLQIILFDKLQLPAKDIKRGKTGYSTAATELDKLRGLHPIVNFISEYRELTKLKSTYVDPLPKLVDQNQRLHTTFSQNGSQTGRLSSDSPNLMNIPIRSEVGKEIRRAFVADPGNVLISADYSQFELRLAAVLANDTTMIHAFNKGIDIHAMTAAEIYDLSDIKLVTSDQRRAAKVVNFGVLYGMSPHGLSVATGMTHDAAQTFISKYFEVRQKLLDYMNSLKAKAKKDGYVETLFGRRRPMPDIKSSNWVVRAAAERAAMNMPIQGTEADLMKMAMIKIDQQLAKEFKMLLQIHDSILVEGPQNGSNEVAEMMKKTMENIHKLPVKLEVDVKVGVNWGEL